MTETPARWKLAEVPSRAAQGNGQESTPDSVVWDAASALAEEPIAICRIQDRYVWPLVIEWAVYIYGQ